VVSIHAGWAGWGQDVKAYGKYEVPTFHFDASSGSIAVFNEDPEKYNNIFQLNDVEKAIGGVYGEVIDDMAQNNPDLFPSKTAAIITADDAFGKEMRAAVGGSLKGKGWKIVIEEEVPYGTTEWRPVISKIKSTKPDFIYMEIISVPENASFMQQFLQSPINATVDMGYTMSMPEFLDVLGKNAEGILGNVPGVPGPQPINAAAADWIERYKKKWGAHPPGSTIWVYYGVMIWADAVKAAGDIHNYKAINKYIAEQPHKTIMDGTIKFDNDHKIPIDMAHSYTIQIQSGVKHALYGQPGEPYKDNKFVKPPWFK
jgi:branched-chain amino acid transport system substrate-binding protein